MGSNIREFCMEIDKFSDESAKEFSERFRNFIFRLFKKVVFNTPVDTGRLRASWDLQANAIGNYMAEAVSLGDKKANAVISSAVQDARIMQIISGITPENCPAMWYLYNNVEYAEFVEDGTPKMAPRAMLARAVAEMQPLLDYWSKA